MNKQQPFQISHKRKYSDGRRTEGSLYYQNMGDVNISCRSCGATFNVSHDAYKQEHCLPCLLGISPKINNQKIKQKDD